MKTLIIIALLFNSQICSAITKAECVQIAAEMIVAFCQKPIERKCEDETTTSYALKEREKVDPNKELININCVPARDAKAE